MSTTTTESKQIELLVLGYCRKVLDQEVMNTYPLDILNEIIRTYLNIILFGWIKHNFGDDSENIKFEVEDNVEVSMNSESFVCRICPTNIILDAGTMKSVYWELKVHSYQGNNKVAVYIGFVSYPLSESIKEHQYDASMDTYKAWLGQNDSKNQFGAGLAHWNHSFYCYGGDKYPSYGEELFVSKKRYTFNDGVQIGLKFDFEKNNCQLFYNGEIVATVLDQIPSKLVPAISLWNEAVKIYCSKLQYEYN